MRQWQQDLGAVHSYRRDAVVTEFWPWLLRRGYAGEPDRERMEEFLTRVPRPDVHLRPGVHLSRRWPLADARRLHERDRFARSVREAVDSLLDTLGESPLGV